MLSIFKDLVCPHMEYASHVAASLTVKKMTLPPSSLLLSFSFIPITCPSHLRAPGFSNSVTPQSTPYAVTPIPKFSDFCHILTHHKHLLHNSVLPLHIIVTAVLHSTFHTSPFHNSPQTTNYIAVCLSVLSPPPSPSSLSCYKLKYKIREFVESRYWDKILVPHPKW